MKKLTALFLSTLMVLTLVISMATFAVSAETTPITADKSWYNETQTEFTITTPEQLLGFAELVSGVRKVNEKGEYVKENNNFVYDVKGVTFEGKTVKLGNDITMNKDFDGNKPADASNLVEYSMSYDDSKFHGTFDGQNHVIIGLYMEEATTRASMFASVDAGKTATVKNLAIIKSYISVIGNQTGCLFGRVNGTANISNCYVDVNMDFALEPSADRWGFSGFIGVLENANAVANISNCVFAGDLNIPATRAMVAGFIARAENYKTITITNSAMYGNIPTGSNNSISGFIGRVVNRTASITFEGCICAGGGEGISGAFWTPQNFNAENTVDVQIKKSLYTLTYPDASPYTDVDESILIEGETIIGTAATSVLTENGLTNWDAVDGYYPLPKAMSGMVAVLQLPTLVVEGEGDEPGDEPSNEPNNSTNNATEDKTDDTTDTEAATTAAEKETTADEKGGCGSIIGGGIALVAVATVGSCVFVAKKKD